MVVEYSFRNEVLLISLIVLSHGLGSDLQIQCPEHKNSPFSLLVSPLQHIQIKRPTLLVRHQSERIRENVQLLAPSETSVPHSAVPKIPAEQNAAESVTESSNSYSRSTPSKLFILSYLHYSTFKLNVPFFWFVASPSESEKTFNYWLLLKVPCHTVWFLRCGFIFTTFKFVGFTLHCPKYKTSSVLLNRTLPSP
jgi:hypothetical protein